MENGFMLTLRKIIEEYGESSTNESGKVDVHTNPSENLLNNNQGYQKGDASVPDKLDYKAISEKYEIKPEKLKIIRQALGEGHYGDVHMGILSLPIGNIPVAVKTTKRKTGAINAKESEDIRKRQRQALREELRIFEHLQSSSEGGHENVLKLLGAITSVRTDFCLLTEYCECGSMDRFLQAKWKNGHFVDELVIEANENKIVWKIQRDSKWGEDFQSRREKGLITTSDLLWFALQIARGMEFLAAKNILHRDSAVRNVLLKTDLTLKVADFGLSRKLRENDDGYYIGKEGTAIPILYIAPESLKSRRFAITSEYWSFGVVVWELFTFAEKKPYSELDHYENNEQFYEFLVQHLSSGKRLSIPDNVPRQIKSLLSRLWHSDQKKRPSFKVCRNVIEQELMQSCPNILSKEQVPVSDPTVIPVDPKVKRRIVVTFGLSVVLWITVLTALGICLLNKQGADLLAQLFVDAEQGDAQAQFHLGSLYENGQGVNQSSEEAVKWYSLAAKQGEARAQNSLGKMYNEGKGVNQSFEKAVKWFREAADQGNADAQYNLGLMYYNGKGVNQSYEEAVKWFREAADQGNADAQYNLGLMYYNGKGANQSYEDAVKWYTKAAEQGNADAQNNLGDMYRNGQGVSQSEEEAVKWYRKSAEQGHASAQYNLGWMYENGRDVPQSFEEIVKWYTKAAEQGNADAQNNLGDMYLHGQGVLYSAEEAVKWYRKSAEQGHAVAQSNLGIMYDYGRGVPESDEEAVKWYRRSAEQGNAEAQNSLGVKYESGQAEEAVKWYRKSAEQGFAAGQYNLGKMYRIGSGVPQSDEEYHKWHTKYLLSAAN